MTVIFLPQPTFKWPSVGDTVTILPPSSPGTLAVLRRPDLQKSDVISESPGNKTQLRVAQSYEVEVVEVVDMERWGPVAQVTLSP